MDQTTTADFNQALTQIKQWSFSTQRTNRRRKKLGKQHPSQ